MFKLGLKRNVASTDSQSRPLLAKSSANLLNEARALYEQEADQAAEKVMSASQPKQSGRQGISHNIGSPRAGEGSDSGGHVLDSKTQEFFEHRFGHNFANVRIHSGPTAAESARGVGARAYTVGNNITFGANEYQPSTRQGRHLLAHELAHVVQQSPASSYPKSHNLAASLTRVSRPSIQRQLIATGDPAGFAALANSVITVQQEVVVSPAGLVSLRTTAIQGPPTPEAQELLRVLQTVINDPNSVSIEFIHGMTSTRPSDARVMVGSYPQSKIDLDDVAAFGTQGSVGLGQGRTAGALLSHEITEQYRKQVFAESFDVAHPQGEAAESAAVGGTRGTMTSRQVNATTLEFSVPYTYPDGRVVVVTWDVVNGNVMNVRRTVRP
jgi:hypothetical protein